MNRLNSLVCIGAVWVAAAAAHDSERWPVRAEQTIERTLPLSGSSGRLSIENFQGFVHVTGTDGSGVRVRAHKVIRADAEADKTQAEREVALAFSNQPDSVAVDYNAPWICRGEGRHCEDQHRRFYSVTFDLTIEMPRNARLFASTVLGDVQVNGTAGNFDVKNVNGAVTLDRVSGSGEIQTVNGPVTLLFTRNPKEPCGFKTVNGSLDVTFAPGLSADLLFKTMNGEIYSGFDIVARATSVSQAGRNNGRFVYRSNRECGARAGSGGPELRFETLNGNINLRTARGNEHGHE